METRARFILVGLFAVVAIAAGFLFVYWLNNMGGLGERAIYQVRFEGSVAGLRPGAAVLFNGIRVGDVTRLQLNPDDPGEVLVTVSVERTTPVRADTKAGMDFQGLLGSASVSLVGGTPSAPPLANRSGEPAVLTADPAESRDLTGAARETLQRLDKVLTENADPLAETLRNLSTFSGALARNADRVDTILSGLERLTAGGPAKSSPRIYDLTAPRVPRLDRAPEGQTVVADPTVPVVLDTQRILVTTSGEEPIAMDDAQWADTIPKMVQARIIESLEKAGYSRVGRPTDGITADHQLLIEIRQFQVSPSHKTALIALSAKVVGEGGRIIDAKVIESDARVSEINSASVAAAVNEAFGRAMTELVTWFSQVDTSR
jgi:phospholipid/cholesterol/gamma-HCH transport system substrate-binding protein